MNPGDGNHIPHYVFAATQLGLCLGPRIGEASSFAAGHLQHGELAFHVLLVNDGSIECDGVKVPFSTSLRMLLFFLGKDGYTGIPLENFNSWEAQHNRGLDEDVFFCKWVILRFPVNFQHVNRVVEFPYVLSSQSHEFSGCVMMCPWQPTLWHVLTKLCCGKWGPEIHQRTVHTIF